MKKQIYYRQCVLKKQSVTTTSWLPEKFAKQGKVLKLKNDGVWDNGWKVDQVGSRRVLEDEVRERSQDYKHQREASDI